MKIKSYKDYVEKPTNEHWRYFEDSPYDDDYDDEDNYREDEYAHLNDNLPINKKSEFDDDYEYGNYEEDDYENDDDVDVDDMQHLLYLLRTMFKNSGVEDVYVESKKMDISISVEMRRRETIKDIMRVFEVANKLKKDILAQYDSEFEMWETKQGKPMFVFNFYYDEGLEDDNMPF
jgi:hypothetical protein